MQQIQSFGKLPDGRNVSLFTLQNNNGMQVQITDWAGAVVCLFVPDAQGNLTDVVLGYATLEGYLQDSSFLGALVGRYGNRIANGQFTIDGKSYQLPLNDGVHHLHGGPEGFGRRLWNTDTSRLSENILILTLHSPDGDAGYPGNIDVSVKYTLTQENTLRIEYHAVTDKKTIINLTNHSYFNLSGAKAGNILDHEVQIFSNAVTATDAQSIPTGEIRPIQGTPLDFTRPKAIGEDICSGYDQIRYGSGYDINYILKPQPDELSIAARVHDPKSERAMEVWTTEAGMQFYTGNFLDNKTIGKEGIPLTANLGVCFETQYFPDAPNHPAFPQPLFTPDKPYHSNTEYRFK